MILVADSGSTKTNWLSSDQRLIRTAGMNPMFRNSASMLELMEETEDLCRIRDDVSEIYFYGAACSSADRNLIVKTALEQFFTKALTVAVEHDLKAAAVATYTGTGGIACILGTGSNSCYYDGIEVSEVVPALGYILGDEGSGNWLGKNLLTLHLYHQLPADLSRRLTEDYGAEKEKIFNAVYRQPFPNVYMASFARVLSETTDTEFTRELVCKGFRKFMDAHVCCYKNHREVPVHFVGSIAYTFRDMLKAVAEEYQIQIGLIEQNPVYRLLDFHSQKG